MLGPADTAIKLSLWVRWTRHSWEGAVWDTRGVSIHLESVEVKQVSQEMSQARPRLWKRRDTGILKPPGALTFLWHLWARVTPIPFVTHCAISTIVHRRVNLHTGI